MEMIKRLFIRQNKYLLVDDSTRVSREEKQGSAMAIYVVISRLDEMFKHFSK